MRRGWITTLLVVFAVLLSGCLADSVAKGAKIGATQIAGKAKEAAGQERTPSPTREAQSEESSGDQSTSAEATDEPTVDPSTLGAGTPIRGECFEGFPLYPGASENEDAKSAARIMSGVFKNPQLRGYATKDGAESVKAFYDAKPADAGWEAAPIQGGQRGGGIYYWGKESQKLLIITLVGADDKTKLTTISMVCGQTE
jgi:hypothetical protein